MTRAGQQSVLQALEEGDAIRECALCDAGRGCELVEAVECAGAYAEVHGHTVFHESGGVGDRLRAEEIQLTDLEVSRRQIVE